jgi:hypothetical protein
MTKVYVKDLIIELLDFPLGYQIVVPFEDGSYRWSYRRPLPEVIEEESEGEPGIVSL